MENEHLQQRLRDLRAQDCLLSAMSDAQTTSHATQYQMGSFPLNSTPFASRNGEDTLSFEDSSSGMGASSIVNESEDGDMPKKKVIYVGVKSAILFYTH